MKELTLFDSNNNSSFDLRTNGEMVNLTDIWKGAGSPKSKDPRFWVRNESTIQLIETVGGILNVSESHIINFKKGKGGGSWGHKHEFAEALASNLIKEKNLKGNANCELASYHSSKIVANSVMQSRKEFINKSI